MRGMFAIDRYDRNAGLMLLLGGRRREDRTDNENDLSNMDLHRHSKVEMATTAYDDRAVEIAVKTELPLTEVTLGDSPIIDQGKDLYRNHSHCLLVMYTDSQLSCLTTICSDICRNPTSPQRIKRGYAAIDG